MVSPARADPVTTMHVRRAVAGDTESVGWLVERFAPLLLAQARMRLPAEFRSVVEPEDLVQDAWAVALPRLGELPARDGRMTPVVLRFLGTTILYRVSNLMQRRLERTLRAPDTTGAEGGARLSQLPASESLALTRAIRGENCRLVLDALDRLDETDRRIVVMRGIEEAPVAEVAAILRMKPNTVTVRYRRLLAKLRAALPRSIFDDLDDDAGATEEVSGEAGAD
jgi:RNA polymerase sigma-70 factor (ECF subfamily)